MHNLLVGDQFCEFDWTVRVRNAEMQNEIVLDATGDIHNKIHVAFSTGCRLMSMRTPPRNLYHFAFFAAVRAQYHARKPENI